MLINNLKVDKDDFTACNIDEKPERNSFFGAMEMLDFSDDIG